MNNKYKIIAKALLNGQLAEAEMPDSLSVRTVSLSELKKIVREEFEKATPVADVEAKESHLHDAELAKEINWVKTLKLENFFLSEAPSVKLTSQEIDQVFSIDPEIVAILTKVGGDLTKLSPQDFSNVENAFSALEMDFDGEARFAPGSQLDRIFRSVGDKISRAEFSMDVNSQPQSKTPSQPPQVATKPKGSPPMMIRKKV